MDEKRVEDWAVEWIGGNVDPYRWCYHNLGHARSFVEDVTEFGRASGISGDGLVLLRTAGWLHDIGYAIDPAAHEEASAWEALKLLPRFGYTPEQSRRVAGLIRATMFTYCPGSLMEELMHDADVGRLGSGDFVAQALLFRLELERGGSSFSDAAFWRFEADFLDRMTYCSAAARKLRGPGLEHNRAWVAGELRRLDGMEVELQ